MTLDRLARIASFSALTLLVVACTSSDPSSDPAPEPADPATDPAPAMAAPVIQAPSTAADRALVAEAQKSTDMRSRAERFAEKGWAGGDYSTATIERSTRGDSVAVRFTRAKDSAVVDLIYTLDETGERIALLRPLDAASSKALEETTSESDDDVASDEATPDELAALVPEPDLDDIAEVGTAKTEAARACGHLFAGQTLHVGDKLWSCKNGYALYMQPDGNLVLYAPGSRATWSSKTNGKGGYRATMQKDGNFVVYDKHNKALWASGHRHAGDQLDIQNDGNLVKNTCGTVSWSTGTYCESGCVGVCKSWSCTYKSSIGVSPLCFALPGNPLGRYHYETHRWGRTVPGFCGTGLYAAFGGNGISCPTSHSSKEFVCDY